MFEQNIEQMLESAKITSLSQIVGFITQQVADHSNQLFQGLQLRVCELQKPKAIGMDRIMIQEVKTIIEAMIDQREDCLKRQIQRKYRDTHWNSFQVAQNSRRSLHQIDFINMMNMHQGTQSLQFRKNNENQCPQPHKTDMFLSEVKQMRQELLNKPERRQIQELKNNFSMLSKQMATKVNFNEVQRILLQFQKQIFIKLGEHRNQLQESQIKLSASLQEQKSLFRQQIIEPANKSASKTDRKVKKYLQQSKAVSFKLQELSESIQKVNEELVNTKKSFFGNIEGLQNIIVQMADQKQSLLLRQSTVVSKPGSAMWMSAPLTYKNSQVAWQKQVMNDQPSNFQFEPHKTEIRVMSAGFYLLSCWVFGGDQSLKKGALIVCNGSVLGRLKHSSQVGQSSRWSWNEAVHIRQKKSSLSVKFQGQENSSHIFLKIEKLFT